MEPAFRESRGATEHAHRYKSTRSRRRPQTTSNRFRSDAPVLPLPKLQLITCGVHDAGLEGYDGDALRNGLDAFVSYFVEGKPMIHIDAREFRDPSHDLRYHNGMHPEIIARMVAHQHFPHWLANVHHEFVTVLSEWGSRHAAQPTMSVIIYCRSGRHRAVAASEILKHVAAHVVGLECLPTVHCSLDERTCRCQSCVPNRPNCRSVTESMMKAIDIWNLLEIEQWQQWR